MIRTFKFYSLSNFQKYNTILLTIVTLLNIIFPGLIYLVIGSFYLWPPLAIFYFLIFLYLWSVSLASYRMVQAEIKLTLPSGSLSVWRCSGVTSVARLEGETSQPVTRRYRVTHSLPVPSAASPTFPQSNLCWTPSVVYPFHLWRDFCDYSETIQVKNRQGGIWTQSVSCWAFRGTPIP